MQSIINVFPPSLNVNRNLDGHLPSAYLHTESYYVVISTIGFHVITGRKLLVSHTSLQTRYMEQIFMFLLPHRRGVILVTSSHYLFGVEAEGETGLVCNLAAWPMPPAHHRKAKARPYIH